VARRAWNRDRPARAETGFRSQIRPLPGPSPAPCPLKATSSFRGAGGLLPAALPLLASTSTSHRAVPRRPCNGNEGLRATVQRRERPLGGFGVVEAHHV
jgi:hypothetical protein